MPTPTSELQVYVETITPGSIRFGLKLTKKQIVVRLSRCVATVYIAKDIVVELFSSYLYDTLKADPICKMDVQPDGSLVFEANVDCAFSVPEAADRSCKSHETPPSHQALGGL